MNDPRAQELLDLAAAENMRLPYPVDYILFLEDHGRMVDLCSGEVLYSLPVAVPTANAQAVLHLLAGVEGAVNW